MYMDESWTLAVAPVTMDPQAVLRGLSLRFSASPEHCMAPARQS